MAKNLRIGVLINTMYSDYSISFVSGVEKFCKENDCECIVFPLLREKNSGRFDYNYDTNLSFLNSNNVDVLVLNSVTLANFRCQQDFIDEIRRCSNVPMVSVGVPIFGIPGVYLDPESAIRQLVTHLVKKHKKKRFLLVHANSKSEESRERTEYFKKALLENGIVFDESKSLDGDFEFDRAFRFLEEYIKEKGKDGFDVVFCTNDNMAQGCIKCLAKYNIRVPDDIAVTGFDNVVDSGNNRYKITTIDQLVVNQAYTGAQVAFNLYHKGKVSMTTTIEAVPVFRNSCGCKNWQLPIFNKKNRSHEFDSEKKYGTDNVLQLYMLHRFLVEAQDLVAIERMYSRLSYSFHLFDISAVLLVLYKEPIRFVEGKDFVLPSEATVVMKFTEDEGLSLPNIQFSPKEKLVPDSMENIFLSTRTVMPLFVKDEIYGYMVLCFGKYEKIFYQSIYELLSKEIIASLKISDVEEKVLFLEKENLTLERYSEEMKSLSRTDEMTGLLNRRGFYDLGQRNIDKHVHYDRTGLVIYGDMDGLKKINDTFGHDMGDKAIRLEAQVLESVFRATDIIGRLGGDEFGIVAFDMKMEDMQRIRQDLDAKCEQINIEENLEFNLSISLGCVEFTKDLSELTILLIKADKELYKEKYNKKNCNTGKRQIEK